MPAPSRLLALAGLRRRRQATREAAGEAGTADGGLPPGARLLRRARALTGRRRAERGQDLVDGAKMAIAELNVRGGVIGQKVALVTYDDGCDARDGRASARRR